MDGNRKITLYDRRGRILATAALKADGRLIEDDEVGTVHMNFNDFVLKHGDLGNLSRVDIGEPQPKTLIQIFQKEGMLDTADPILLK